MWEQSGLRLLVAVGLFLGVGEGNRVGIPQVSCSLRLPLPTLAPTCSAGPELPGVKPQAHKHFVRNSAGRAGLAGSQGGLGCAAPHLSLRGLGHPEPRLWLAAASGGGPHLFSMSICTLWTRSRAICRISWAS